VAAARAGARTVLAGRGRPLCALPSRRAPLAGRGSADRSPGNSAAAAREPAGFVGGLLAGEGRSARPPAS